MTMSKSIDEYNESFSKLQKIVYDDIIVKYNIDEPILSDLNSSLDEIRDILSEINKYHERYFNYYSELITGTIPKLYNIADFKEFLAIIRDQIQESNKILKDWETLQVCINSNPTLQTEWNRFMMLIRLTENEINH